jgi:putative DNA primase/helicase
MAAVGVPTERVLSLLQGVRTSGQGWVARCPAHDDSIQSLKVDERSDHSVLLHCHAGCRPAAVVTALGLTFSDLFESRAESPQARRIVETYDYRDLNGALLYQSIRFDPKEFRQRRPDERNPGKWVWNMKALKGKLVPYRLNELRGHTTVWIVEGEKDANRLWALGKPGTTNIGGAGKWTPNCTKSLVKAGVSRVIIFPDNDDAGRDHAARVATSVREKGIHYSIVELPDLPDKGDVSDWLDAGHTAADLEHLVGAQPFVIQAGRQLPVAVDEVNEAEPQEPGTLDASQYHMSDLGLAEAFRDRYGEILRYDLAAEAWYVWSEHRWDTDQGAMIRRLAHNHVRRLQIEATKVPEFTKRSAVLAYACKQEKTGSFDTVLKESKVLDPILVSQAHWNEDPWLLGVRNGVIDLRTGGLRPGERADLITKQAGPAYDPDAECPKWLEFLGQVFDDDQTMVDYLHRAIGYSLTGQITEQCFFMTSGAGGNGKSTLLTTIGRVLGQYSHTTDIRTFSVVGDSVPYELAQLAGARMIVTSEARTRTHINEQVLKTFTGGEEVEARHIYGHPFRFRPIGKIWFAVNHAPKVDDESYGFWRRVRMIPFDRTFSGSTMDKTLGEKLEAEAAGILAWAVRGCLLWQSHGLGEPLKVVSATDAYQQSEDPLSEFYEERCDIGPGLSVAGSVLYAAYRAFALEQGTRENDKLTGAAFGRQVSRTFQKQPTAAGKFYQGISVKKNDLYQ